MNYYFHFFEYETVLPDSEQLIAYISNVPGIEMTTQLAEEIRQFCEEETNFPRRWRVQKKCTFIIIKTTAETLEQFKDRGSMGGAKAENSDESTSAMNIFDEIHESWYRVIIKFKRVVVNPQTGKGTYVDDEFEVRMFANSQRECYDRCVEYLTKHPEIDPRSQMPSIKSKNFCCQIDNEN